MKVSKRILASEFRPAPTPTCTLRPGRRNAPVRDPEDLLGLVEVRADPDALDPEVLPRHDLLDLLQGKQLLKYALWDTIAGMVFSEIVAYFIILTTGASLFVAGKHDVASATEAAQALRPLAGDASALLLAIGLIGAGVLAVPVLTGSAAYGVSEAFGWRSGLDRKPAAAWQFYLVIVAATLVGMVINFLGINAITALVLSAVLNGIIAVPLVFLLMIVCNDRAAMGERTNGRLLNVLGWVTTIVMGVAAVGLIVTTILG